MSLNKTEGEAKASRSLKRWVGLAILLMLLLAGLLDRDELFFLAKQSGLASHKSKEEGMTNVISKEDNAMMPGSDGSSTAYGNSDSASPEKLKIIEQREAPLFAPSDSVPVIVSTPNDIKLALVNVERIFDGSDKIQAAQAELKRKRASGEQVSDAGLQAAKEQVAEELKREIEAYSRLYGFDLVIDTSGESAAGNPIFLYVKPGLPDITDEILARLNAPQDGK